MADTDVLQKIKAPPWVVMVIGTTCNAAADFLMGVEWRAIAVGVLVAVPTFFAGGTAAARRAKARERTATHDLLVDVARAQRKPTPAKKSTKTTKKAGAR